MRNYTFLFKENGTDDRDCVRYVELQDIKDGHLCCDGKFNVHGACYSMSLKEDVDYDNITTILTKEEYQTLCNPINKDLTSIIRKLESEENEELFERVVEEEIEYLKGEYSLSDEDIKYIFNEYYLDYRDRGIVGYVYNDSAELGYEEAYDLGYIKRDDPISERYFDYEKFGEDLLEDERYLELDNGRVVSLNY